MYAKLAAGNVKKSYRDYSIYFVTLAFSVCLFYTFHSFDAQQNAMNLNELQRSLLKNMGLIMDILSVFVAFVFGFLIVYANRFLIRRRQKELGIYQLLGMRKAQISRILVYETLLVGIVSMAVGLLLGVVASQAMIYGTVRIFGLSGSYEFLFSSSAALKTLISFALIFLVVILLNMRALKKYKLIDFWQAQSRKEGFRAQSSVISIAVFLLALVVLGVCYHLSNAPLTSLMVNLWPIVLSGALGTLLLFISLSGLLIRLTRGGKAFYYRNLNMFVLRQLSSKIRTTYWTMTFVCILQVLAIGAFATGIGASVGVQRTMQLMTPFDYSYTSNRPTDKANRALERILSNTDGAKLSFETKIYDSDCNMGSLMEKMKKRGALGGAPLDKWPVEAVSLTDMNKNLVLQGKQPVSLGVGETLLFTNVDGMEDALNSIPEGSEFQIFGKTLKLKRGEVPYLVLCTSSQGDQRAAFVVNDEVIPKDLSPSSISYNVNLKDGLSGEEFKKKVYKQIQEYNKPLEKKDKNRLTSSGDSREEVVRYGKEFGVLMAYVGVYLGVVFLISSAVMLALQQLSEANDNRLRYRVLLKLGVPNKMRDQSILMQISTYFFLPLALAVVHGAVGLRMMNRLMMAMGSNAILDTAFLTGGLVLLIYGLYFIITYKGYQQTLRQS